LTTNELRKANDQLRRLDQQKDDFLSQVSHELRTPMTSIRSFAEILLSPETVTDAERNRFVSIIYEESRRLTRLLNEILDMGLLEAGSLEISISSVEAGSAIDAAIDTLNALIRKKQVRIERQLQDLPAWVQANEARMQQILINLISNSIKYNTSAQPAIQVRTESTGDSLLIDITDNGGGVRRGEAATSIIAPNQLDREFFADQSDFSRVTFDSSIPLGPGFLKVFITGADSWGYTGTRLHMLFGAWVLRDWRSVASLQ